MLLQAAFQIAGFVFMDNIGFGQFVQSTYCVQKQLLGFFLIGCFAQIFDNITRSFMLVAVAVVIIAGLVGYYFFSRGGM